MALINLSTVLPEVMPHVPGCPRMMIMNELRNAVIEFCDESRFWRVSLPSFTTITGQALYTLANPTGQNIISIENMRSDVVEIHPKTEEEMDIVNTRWRINTGAVPYAYIMQTPSSFIIYPIPTYAKQIFLKASVKPEKATDTIDDYVLNEYYRTIAAGALSELAAMPNQVWSNPDMHAFYKTRFESGKLKAEADRLKGFSRATLRSVASDTNMRSSYRRRSTR